MSWTLSWSGSAEVSWDWLRSSDVIAAVRGRPGSAPAPLHTATATDGARDQPQHGELQLPEDRVSDQVGRVAAPVTESGTAGVRRGRYRPPMDTNAARLAPERRVYRQYRVVGRTVPRISSRSSVVAEPCEPTSGSRRRSAFTVLTELCGSLLRIE